MRVFVEDNEIERVKKNLEITPTISDTFGKAWINDNFLNKEERVKKHAMFWIFLDESKCKKMEEWLSTLKAKLPETKFIKIVNSLKEKRGGNEFYSFVPEIEVLSYYKKQENDTFNVEYEPAIPGKTKVGDIKLAFDKTEVFIEITRLFSSEEEARIDKMLETLRKKIDEIEKNPFIITFGIRENFVEPDIEPFVRLVNQKIDEQRDAFKKVDGEPFTVNFDGKGGFKFHEKLEHKKGYVGGMLSPVLMIETAGRLKHKILDEIEQLPEDQLNVIVLDISHHFAHFDDIEDAFAGQEGLRIDVKTMETTPVRYANGVIQIDKGKRVSALIGFKGFDYENRKKYVNLSATVQFTEETLSKI